MIPTIDRRATGVNIRRIMDRKNISVKDLQRYLQLGSIQSIYHWLNGICLPSLDNLYAMSIYFQMPLDSLICGTDRPLPVSRAAFIFWEKYSLTWLTAHLQSRAAEYCN